MPVADTSYLVKSRLLKGKTLSVFKKLNGGRNEFIGSDFSQNEYSVRDLGDKFGGCCCVSVGPVTVTAGDPYPSPPPYDTNEYSCANDIEWTALENATSYTVSAVYQDDTITTPVYIVNTGLLSATVYYQLGYTINVTVTARNECSSSTETVTPATACFLAGALVLKADGFLIPIEDIKVGDLVVGAFGEINPVLALHRPLLGSGEMCLINAEHMCTTLHPHISGDKKFYCKDPTKLDDTVYGQSHEVIDASGNIITMMLHGLKKGRVQELTVGVELQIYKDTRVVELLEVFSMSPDTQLYNLVVGGSHTYIVENYAVTGWPREDDFDYDTWTPIVPSS